MEKYSERYSLEVRDYSNNNIKNIYNNWELSDGELSALIVDIHGFTGMVSHREATLMAQFTRDVLYGAVKPTEKNNGIIANTMGDATLSIFPTADRAFRAALWIIHDYWDQHEYIKDGKRDGNWQWVEKGIYCRCSIETGYIEIDVLPVQQGDIMIWVGVPINYAQRLIRLPEEQLKNPEKRKYSLIVGPNAYKLLCKNYEFGPPLKTSIKGRRYIGYPYDTREIWGD